MVTDDPATPTFDKLYNNEVGVARALYSNSSEYPDELAFKRGDTLRILHDPIGPELSPGWWECVDTKGKRGIAPANRLEVMQPFDKSFFSVAKPILEDFFMFGSERADPFDTAFGNDRNRRFFAPFFDDFEQRSASPSRLHATHSAASIAGFPSNYLADSSPANRLSRDDVSFRGVIRNIPIRVENRESSPATSTYEHQRNSGSFLPAPQPVRRAASSGHLSPPLDPSDVYSRPSPLSSLRESSSPLRGSQGTLLGGSPARERSPFADFPSQRKGAEEASPVERLAQRLKNLTSSRPFSDSKADSARDALQQLRERELTVPITSVDRRSPSPSSSGIVADINEGSNVSDEGKRSSDLSSLSGGSDNNSSFDPPSEDSMRVGGRVAERAPPPPAPAFATPSSTSALLSVFDSIERPNLRTINGSGNARSDPHRRSVDDFMPSSVAEDIRRNEQEGWRTVPTKMSTTAGGTLRNINSISDTEMASRKKMVVHQMAESLRMINIAKDRLAQATAAQFWREPHVLQKNLNEIRDSVITINESLDRFVDTTARIAIDNGSPKNDELRSLLLPLRDSRAIIGALRQALDLGGWTLATLARDKHQPRVGLDSIEQFRIVVKRVPQECNSFLDWLSSLAPDPPRVCFMALNTGGLPSISTFGSSPLTPRAIPISTPSPLPPQPTILTPSVPSPVPSDDSKRLSSSSTSSSTVTSGDSSTSPPSSILKQSNGNGNGGRSGPRVTFADGVDYDEVRVPRGHFSSAPGPSAMAAASSSLLSGEASIVEEDDLESVLSERDSLVDYAQLDEPLHKMRASNGNLTRNGGRIGTVHKLSDEDRQIVRFYAPQLGQHTDALALAIDEFIDVVEHQLPPNEFVQKGKLIILAAHKLVYIGDSVSQCVKDAKLSLESRAGADSLCNLLKECVSATKTAAEEYPNVTFVQRMVDSIVGVSKAATDLKMLIESNV